MDSKRNTKMESQLSQKYIHLLDNIRESLMNKTTNQVYVGFETEYELLNNTVEKLSRVENINDRISYIVDRTFENISDMVIARDERCLNLDFDLLATLFQIGSGFSTLKYYRAINNVVKISFWENLKSICQTNAMFKTVREYIPNTDQIYEVVKNFQKNKDTSELIAGVQNLVSENINLSDLENMNQEDLMSKISQTAKNMSICSGLDMNPIKEINNTCVEDRANNFKKCKEQWLSTYPTLLNGCERKLSLLHQLIYQDRPAVYNRFVHENLITPEQLDYCLQSYEEIMEDEESDTESKHDLLNNMIDKMTSGNTHPILGSNIGQMMKESLSTMMDNPDMDLAELQQTMLGSLVPKLVSQTLSGVNVPDNKS